MKAFLTPYLSPGDGVIDIGANEGVYSEAYARCVGPSGYVLAVEPDPESMDVCRRRCAKLPQVSYVTIAVADRCGKGARLYRDQDRKRNSLWAANRLQPTSEEAIVTDTITLDQLAALSSNLRGVKIDAQGAEAAILDGAPETLARPDVTWAIEIWPEGLKNAGSSYGAVIDKLAAHGLNPVGGKWADLLPRLAMMSGHKSADVIVRHR